MKTINNNKNINLIQKEYHKATTQKKLFLFNKNYIYVYIAREIKGFHLCTDYKEKSVNRALRKLRRILGLLWHVDVEIEMIQQTYHNF